MFLILDFKVPESAIADWSPGPCICCDAAWARKSNIIECFFRGLFMTVVTGAVI